MKLVIKVDSLAENKASVERERCRARSDGDGDGDGGGGTVAVEK